MISFLVVSPTVLRDTKKSVKSVIGGQERFDVLSRCLLNLDRWKERIPTDLNLIIYLSNPENEVVLTIPLESFSPLKGELDSVFRLIEIFADPQSYKLNFISNDFEQLIVDLSKSFTLYYLTPEGIPLKNLYDEIDEKSNLCFVLGSQKDLTEKQEQVLYKNNVVPISLGEKDYLASHVITIICHQLAYGS